MNTKVLGVLGILLALACWGALVALRLVGFGLAMSPASIVVEFALVFAGSIIFWRWIIGVIDRQAAEVRTRTQHLESLHSASIALTTEHDLTAVLQKVVDLSRVLLNAKYGALGVLADDGVTIDQMMTSGLSAAARARMDQLPRAHGLLGAPLVERRSVRIDSIAADARSRGFPPNHPVMQSFLGVPIVSKGRIFGNLYLTDKLPDLQSGRSQPTGFSQEDQEILEMFANQAAIAIENAQLYRQNQQIAVLQERERFGMDLHDGVIQSIYAIGLMLDASRHQLHHSTADAAQGIESALRSLDQVIKDIRAYIHDLRAQQVQGRNLQQGLEDLARQLQTYSVLTVDVTADPAALQRLTPAQTSDMLQIAREALSNIRKHAHATEVTICVSATPRDVVLTIEDNGSGLDNGSAKTGGYGLNNMAARARHLNGELTVASLPTRGTRVSVAVPV